MSKYKNIYRQPKFSPRARYLNLVDGEWDTLQALLPARHRLLGLLVNCSVKDLSLLEELSSLRKLSISEFASGGFDLSRLTNLEDLFLHVGRERPIHSAGDELQSLHLVRCDTPWAHWIPGSKNLVDLRLNHPHTIPASIPSSVRRIEISQYKPKSSFSWGEIALDDLSLVNIRGMSDLRGLGWIKVKRRLYIEDCNELERLDGVSLEPGATLQVVGKNSL